MCYVVGVFYKPGVSKCHQIITDTLMNFFLHQILFEVYANLYEVNRSTICDC